MKNKLLSVIKNKNFQLVFILTVLGLLIRFVKLNDLASFDSDQEFFAYEAKKIIIDHNLTLIGIPTQIGGILIGPLFTYIASIFFVITKGNPAFIHLTTIFLNILAVPVAFFVAKNLINTKAGVICAIIVAFSKSSVVDSLAGWAVTPILPTTFLFIYFLIKFLEGGQKYLPLIFITIALGLNWHVMTGFYLLVFIISLIIFRPKISLSKLIVSVILFVIILSPLFLFDIRHGFVNTKSILSLFQNKTNINFFDNFYNVLRISISNSVGFLIPNLPIPTMIPVIVFFGGILRYIFKNRSLLNKVLFIFLVSVIFTASLYKGRLSEYYLAVLSTVFILIFSSFFSSISKKYLNISLILFLIINIYATLKSVNSLNLKYKKEAVSYILRDSLDNNIVVHIDSGYGSGSGFKYLFEYYKKTPVDNGNNLYLISIPFSQKRDHTIDLVLDNYKSENPTVSIFGDIGVVKIQ